MNLNAKYDVFVSYSRKDYVDESNNPIEGSVISELLSFLDSNNISYWFDKEGIYSGSEFLELITNAITESKMMIFVSSEYSNTSKYTTGEIFEALDQDKLIVPFKIDDSPYNKKYRMLVRPLDFIEYYANPKVAFESLLKAINTCKDEYKRLLKEAQRHKEEENAKRREAEIIKEIKEKSIEYQRYSSNLKLLSLSIIEKQKSIGNKDKKCPICSTQQPIDNLYCQKCGWTFNPIFEDKPKGDKDHIFLMQGIWKFVEDSDNLTEKLKEKISNLEETLKEKEQEISLHQMELSKMQNLTKELSIIKDKREDYHSMVSKLQSKLSAVEENLSLKEILLNTSENEKIELNDSVRSLASEICEYVKVIENLQIELERSKQNYNLLRNELQIQKSHDQAQIVGKKTLYAKSLEEHKYFSFATKNEIREFILEYAGNKKATKKTKIAHLHLDYDSFINDLKNDFGLSILRNQINGYNLCELVEFLWHMQNYSIKLEPK